MDPLNSDKGKIRETAEVVEGIVKSVPAYQDAIQPAAKEIGKGLETIARSINVALAPLKGLVWGYDRIESYLVPALAEKLKKVPKDQVTAPPIHIAGPAIESLRFAGNEPSLRELYANLLATSMDSGTVHEAHPAFVEILRQLTPDEARIVDLFVDQDYWPRPLITVRRQSKEGRGGYDILRHFSLLGEEAQCSYPEMTPSYVDNLCRLGLAEIPALSELTDAGQYEPLERHPTVENIVAEISASTEDKPEIIKEILKVTTLGGQFCNACVESHHGA